MSFAGALCIQRANPIHLIDTIGLSCSATVCYIPHTVHELHLVETQSLSHSWRQTLKQLR